MGDNTITEEKKEFKLPNEIVTFEFIPKKKGLAAVVSDDHVISGGMLDNAVKRFVAPLQRNGAIKNVLTDDEKDYLENKTKLDLSVYGDFWKNYAVALRKQNESNKLDLSDPMSYIQYKILLNYPDIICTDLKDTDKKATYQFVLVREGDKISNTKSKLDTKKEAFKLYGKIEDDRDKLLGIARLITNKNLSGNSKLDFLQAEVEKYLDENPSKFVQLMKDASLETKILLNKAVELGIVLRKGNKYESADGLQLKDGDKDPTFNNAVLFLDNPKNEEVRSLIEARIENSK